MTSAKPGDCLTCYGAGETYSENGPTVCPDCFGGGKPPSRGAALEWRLRQLEKTYRGSGRETESDVVWLIHEIRQSREALLAIFARCQDADEADALAREIRFRANDALGLYEPGKA